MYPCSRCPSARRDLSHYVPVLIHSFPSKKLRQIVRDESLTHAEVAQRAGSSRTRVTAIRNGNLDSVSSDLLIRLLSGLGYRVKVSVSRIDSAA